MHVPYSQLFPSSRTSPRRFSLLLRSYPSEFSYPEIPGAYLFIHGPRIHKFRSARRVMGKHQVVNEYIYALGQSRGHKFGFWSKT